MVILRGLKLIIKKILSLAEVLIKIVFWDLWRLLLWDWWHTRILVVNFTGKEDNYGCIATSRSLIKLIKNKYPGSVIRFQHIEYTSPNMNISLDVKNIDKFLPEYILAEKRRFRFFNWAHIIILNGEGSIHEYKDPIANQYCLNKLLQIYAAKKIYKKKAFAINQTIDYWDDNFGFFIKKCYEPLDYIAVRENASFDKAKQCGLKDVVLSADAAFLTKNGNAENVSKKLLKIGIKKGFIFIFLSETILKCNPAKTIDMIKNIKLEFNRDVLLCASTRTDLIHLTKIREGINVFSIGVEVSPEDLIEMLKCADIVLSGRFHCCIFSFLAGTPIIPFASNSHKMEGLIRLMNYPIKVYDYADDTNDAIIEEMRKTFNYSNEIKSKIEKEIPRMKKLAQLNIGEN